jgi:hypothetical protein
MGGVGFPIYGMKDEWGAEILFLAVILDVRHSDVFGHVLLEEPTDSLGLKNAKFWVKNLHYAGSGFRSS